MRAYRHIVLLTLLTGCAGPDRSSGGTPALTVHTVLAEPARWIGQPVTIRAYLVGIVGSCADVVCPDHRSCCSCASEAALADRPHEQDGAEVLPFAGPADAPLGCQVHESCAFDCTFSSGTALAVTGTLHPIDGMPEHHYLAIEHYVIAP